jgi:carbohydrate-selective porin OprB
MRFRHIGATFAATMVFNIGVTALASGGPGKETEPENVEEIVNEAAQTPQKPLVPIDLPLYSAVQSAKKNLSDKYGLDLALSYKTIYQVTSGGIENNQAEEGTLGLFALWKFVRDPNGIDGAAVGFQFELRGNYLSDQFLDMTADLGTLWSPNDSTSPNYNEIKQVWFGQKLCEGKFTYLVGKIDPGAYINQNRFAGSDATQFFSQPFATNPARFFPSNGLGVMARFTPNDWLYFHAVTSDGNANSGVSPFITFHGDWFTGGEVGLTPKIPNLGQGMYRFLLWHEESMLGATTGYGVSFDQNLGDHFGAFLRYGGNDGHEDSIEHIIGTGISILTPFDRPNDQTGIGFSWTKPADHDLRDEYSTEVYYRLQLTEGIEYSVSTILIDRPSASQQDWEAVYGMRLRILY